MQLSLPIRLHEAGEVKSKARSSLKHSQRLNLVYLSALNMRKGKWKLRDPISLRAPPLIPLAHTLHSHTFLLLFGVLLGGLIFFFILLESPYLFLMLPIKYPSFIIFQCLLAHHP